jgi:alkylation response protein AidB-like acyl-CoA dehydrogenase
VKYLHYRRICSKAEFPKQILKGLGDIGGFGPYIPEEYGGAGLDQISRINHARN